MTTLFPPPLPADLKNEDFAHCVVPDEVTERCFALIGKRVSINREAHSTDEVFEVESFSLEGDTFELSSLILKSTADSRVTIRMPIEFCEFIDEEIRE